MKRIIWFFIASLTLSSVGYAQYISGVHIPDTAQSSTVDSVTKYALTITREDMKRHLSILASDEFGGRETGTEGNDKAAEYISRYFKSLGLQPMDEENGYYQKVGFTWITWDNIEIHVNGERYRHLWDFVSFNTENNDLPELKADEVIFLGYGIDDMAYSDYEGVDVEGKIILIYKGEPRDLAGNSWVTRSLDTSRWSTDPSLKLEAAYRRGVKAVLIIEDELKKTVAENRRLLLGPRVILGEPEVGNIPKANACYISTNMAKDIIGRRFKKLVRTRDRINKTGDSKSLRLKTDITLHMSKKMSSLDGRNILGYIEGTNPLVKDELIVLTAHYDHIGQKGVDINNGADDNGSGTTVVLEVTEALAKARKEGVGPQRSVLCMLVTGEEKGLLGSKYYSENPVFPLENTIVNVNIDMVGRVDEQYTDEPEYIYVIGSDRLSHDLHVINETVNQKYERLILDYKYNDEADPNRFYYRSDHYNFAAKGVPAIFFFNGTHADYHRPSDTVEKIRFDIMEKRGRHIFYLVWDLANRDLRLQVNP